MLDGGMYMRMYLIKRERVLLSLILLVSAVLIFPSNASSAGTIKLNKNAVLDITQADSESKGGGPLLRPADFLLGSPNDSYSNKSTKTLRASASVGIGKVKYWAKLSTKFTVARGDKSEISGKARVTVYGGHLKGMLYPGLGIMKAKVLLHMNVADQQKATDEGANILLAEVINPVGGGKYFNDDFEKSIELTVIEGRTYNVDLELETEANGTSTIATADFYSDIMNVIPVNYGVKYQGIKVTILESVPGASGPGRYR